MPTPDDIAGGIADCDELIVRDPANDASEGHLTYDATLGVFVGNDNTGAFNPRDGRIDVLDEGVLVGTEKATELNFVGTAVTVTQVAGVGNEGKKLVTISGTGGGGITEPQHEALDTLAHDIVEDSYDEFIYTGNRVTQIITWTDITKTTKIREQQISYAGSRVTQVIDIQYDGAGVETYRVTEAYTYSGSKVVDVTRTRTP